MTYDHNCTLPEEFLESIAEQGLDVLPELIQTLVNTAMRLERQRYLQANPYERSDQQRLHASEKLVTARPSGTTR